MNGESPDIKQANLQRLKGLFPELFTENQIDWEKLKAAFGDDINFANERYVLNWAGKSDAFRILQQPTTATLKPIPDESVNFDTTENLFIEGENLEVLKALQKAYYGKVKCIIIDPPYNTGSDSFIYPDRFSEKKEDYLKRIGDKDEEGYLMKEGLFRKNSKESGHFHSNWLSMIYPRLFLAKNLLRDDGVIFVHIDDNEVHNLRLVMNEIFGEENFVAQFAWKKRTTKSDVPFGVSQDYEWILSFTKAGFTAGISHERKYYQASDFPNDRWRLADLTKQTTAEERPNSAFGMIDPKTKKAYPFNPNRVWGVTKDTCSEYYNKGKIVFPDDYDFLNINIPAFRVFEREDKAKALKKFGSDEAKKAVSMHLPKEVGMNEDGNKDILGLFNGKVFSFPKPVSLIKHFLTTISEKNSIILDFFGGSGTTAQAVLELNKEDGGNRRFILVQMPEPCDENSEAYKGGYRTIADIAKERIRRVIQKLTSPPAPLLKERGGEVSYTEELFKGASASLFGNARSMRKEKTEAEDKLWQALRNKQIENCKFRRQHPIGNFIADFYCHEEKLAIEVDGGYHNEKEQRAYDEARTQVINEFGVQVMRFSNEEILNNLPEVLNKIRHNLSPIPSPAGEGQWGEVGFKVFKLSPSNFKIWRGSEITEENLAPQLDAFTNPIRPGAEKQDMLYELMLKAGYELTSKVEYITSPVGTGYYSINNNELIIALDGMNEKLIEQIISAKPQKVITLDSLFTGNDQLKTNTVLQMRDAGVDFKTV